MDTSAEGEAFERATVSYENKGARFVISGPRSFQRQYAQLYFSRLARLSRNAAAAARTKWPGVPLVKTLGVGEDVDCVVIGTLFKQQRLRPSVLDEYTKDGALKQALGLTNFCDAADTIVMEDEGARLVLRGASDAALPVGVLVTGTVAAVRGRAESGGDFV
ncbi:DNA polymerase delta small subunit, partial [Monoraphidium neglectum]